MNTKPLLNLKSAEPGYFDRALQCRVERIAYDIKTRTGYIDLPEGSCTDMGGAIALFEAIDPEVRTIYAGDTAYSWDGRWDALSVTEKQRIEVVA